MAALRSVGFQIHPKLNTAAAQTIERSATSRCPLGAQLFSQMLPQQVSQPPLGNAGQVEGAARHGKSRPEVVGFGEAGILGVGRAVVDHP